MSESRCDSDNLLRAQDDLLVEDVFPRQLSQMLFWIYTSIWGFTFAVFVLSILGRVFNWGNFEFVSVVFILSIILSIFVGGVILYRQRIWLGYITNVVIILSVVLLFKSMFFDFVFFLVSFGIFPFFVWPILGIIKEIILIVSKDTHSVRCTTVEILILSIPVMIATWLLLMSDLFDSEIAD